TWVREAARHYYWQMMLTIRYDDWAKVIGNAHEWPVQNTLDTYLDLHHNAMAREAAASLREEFLKEVEGLLGDSEWQKKRAFFSSDCRRRMASVEVWEKQKAKYAQKVMDYTLTLIDSAVNRKDVAGKVIIYPDDPYITKNLGIPLTTRPGGGRPGWPP